MATTITSSDANALTLDELVPILKRCIKVQRPSFLWAGPGIGKSSIVAALAKELGGISIDMRLSQMQPTDIIGIPYFNSDKATMKWAPPELLPTEELASKYPVVILFLDEMNSAPPAVQAAAYQLVLDRRAGAYKLPDNCVIIAAGNRETDRGVTFRMPAPLANRFLHYEIKPDYDSWLNWAVKERIDSRVISFLTCYKSELFDKDAAVSGEKSFATPRSWEFVSNLITPGEDEQPLDDSQVRTFVGSAVGHGTANKFMAHLKYGANLPSPIEILDGKVTKLKTAEISAHYQIIINLLYEMQTYWHANSQPLGTFTTVGDRKNENRKWNNDKVLEQWVKWFNNFNTFILGEVSTEVGIMAMRLALANYALHLSVNQLKLKTWPAVAEKYAKYIQKARG